MFPSFISILDIQSWWEVPSIAHFCSLFRTAFNLLDFDIEDLEEALLTDGTEENSWLQELIVRLLSGCLPNNEISTFNYQMFLRRLFRQKCQEHDRYNPFNTDCDFTLLPLRTKVDILHALCDFRLDAEDVLDQLKNLEADSLRVEPLGYDKNDSAYWYFYGTRLYREDFQKKNNKKKAVWQVICFTEDDWFQLTKKFKSSSVKNERELYHTLSKNFLPELPRLFKEKERQARRRLLENQPRRTSDRIRKLDCDTIEREERTEQKDHLEEQQNQVKEEKEKKKKEQDNRRRESYEKRSKLKEASEESHSDPEPELRHEMASKKRGRGRQRKTSTDSNDSCKELTPPKRKKTRASEKCEESSAVSVKPVVGRQTNNSLSALDGQIIIPQGAPPAMSNKKKLRTSQVFQQTDEDLLVGMHKILDFVKNHDDAWPFVDPVEEEYAPNYYSIIRRPMDLTRMEDRLDQGYYKGFDRFKDDFQLIVNNCRLYNGVENEYTQMVDNLVKVFEKATERYLDQISSSDEEIAVENLNSDEDVEDTIIPKPSKKKKQSESPPRSSNRGRKPVLAAQGKKRDSRLSSEESDVSLQEQIKEPKSKKSKKQEKESKKEDKQQSDKEAKEIKKSDKESKKLEKESRKLDKGSTKLEKPPKKAEKEHKRSEKDTRNPEKASKKGEEKDLKKPDKTAKSKKESQLESKKENKVKDKEKRPKKRGRKKKRASPVRNRTPSKGFSSRSPSPSPPRSILSTPPPSSPEDMLDDRQVFHRSAENPFEEAHNDPAHTKRPSFPWETPFILDKPPADGSLDVGLTTGIEEEKMEDLPPFSPLAFSFKPAKDKHNKLRETIEKLKAKSEISRMQTPVYDFEVDDHLKENKDKNKKPEDKQHKIVNKDKAVNGNRAKKTQHSHHQEPNFESHIAASPSETVNKKSSKKKDKEFQTTKAAEAQLSPVLPKTVKQSNFDALSLATEQTLKDINKWLDDTPKFADFSSASNSPSYLALDDFDLLGTPRPLEQKKIEKSIVPSPVGLLSPMPVVKKDGITGPTAKDGKKKTCRDPSKFFNKRREVQRTIDRLQPGKGKGNLITNVQNVTKTDEIYPLGPLSKMKDTKNSLIVKTDTNAPKLSLGSVLDSFGKHKFVVDDLKKEEEEIKPEIASVVETTGDEEKTTKPGEEANKEDGKENKIKVAEEGSNDEKDVKEIKPAEEPNSGGPTPNLSAWFKAFGAPKAPPPQKKSDKTDIKDEEVPAGAKSERVPPGDPSPILDGPQPVGRQRRISTGSSMSERSSFSQDLDSPRVGMEERGAYPAPYPSPLHRSPSSGASPVMASPRPDISPRSPYPFNGGQIRVGFYQDTVASSKSSPEKSCSPREVPPNSPYYQPTGAEHVYAPNTTQANYSASYTANSPYYTHPPSYSSTNPTPPYNMDGSSNSYYDTTKIVDQYQAKPSQNYTANSPASSQASPAPQPQLSPHSPIVHLSQTSPSLRSPSIQSPSLHSPSIQSPSLHSPSIQSPGAQSPSMHSPSLHSPSVHSPSVHSPSMHSPSMHSPSMHSPSMHSPSMHSSQHSHSPQLPSPGQSLHSPGMSVVSPQVNSPGVQHSPLALNSPSMAVNSPMNPSSVETLHPQQDENTTSNSATTTLIPDQKECQAQQQPNQPVFPVKKRAFLDADLSSQFAALQEEMANRNLQIALTNATGSEEDTAQMQHHLQQQQQHFQKQQQMQEVQEHLLQKHQQHMQKQQSQEVQDQLMQKQQQLQKQNIHEAQEQMLQKHQEHLRKQHMQDAQEQLMQKHQEHLQKQHIQEAQEQMLQKRQEQLKKQQIQEAQEQLLQKHQEQLQKHQEQLQKQHIQEAQEQLLQNHQEQLQKQHIQEAQEQLLQKHQEQLQKQHIQEAQEQLLQKHQEQFQKQQLQEAQEQILQQAQVQLQQQKNQQLAQQQKNQQLLQQQQKNQQMLQEQQKAQQLLQEQRKQQQLLHEQKKQQQLMQEQKQHQLLQEQKQQQQLLQQQKNLQLLQQQAMAAFTKATASASDQSLRTPSPPLLSQQQQTSINAQQQNQRNTQQVTAHSSAESSSSSIRSISSYPASTSSQSNHPYNSNFSSRDAYGLNIPSATRNLQSPHQQKLDMSKFTNMGYSGPEVNFSRALQQQYSRPELSYTRTTVQSAISQASQLLNSQTLSVSQPSASSASSLPGYQKTGTNPQQAHSATYQSGRSVDSVAERLAAQAQQEAAGYKQDNRSSYNSTPLDLEQALGLSRNLSNIVDRYSNEQRMMAGLQSNHYYTDKGLGTSHMFNKQIFSQSNMAAMGYGQQQQQQQVMQQQQQTSTQSIYGRQMAAELQSHDLKTGTAASQPATQERKPRKKKSVAKGSTTDSSSSNSATTSASQASTPSQGSAASQQHGFQSYAGLKTNPASSGSSTLDPAAIALKTSSVPGSAFNFGSGALGMGSGLSDTYPNLLDEFRGTSNYFMGGTNAKPGQSGQGYPAFLNPPAHQGRSAAYAPLGGPFMDTSSQLYQHYLQAGVLNQGLLGAAAAAGGYPPGYHTAALAMRQPYDSMSRPSWL